MTSSPKSKLLEKESDSTYESNSSSYYVEDTPQDFSFIPSLAIFLWLGWYGGSYLILLSIIFISNIYIRTTILSLVTISLLLPRDFPKGYGVLIGNWIAKNAKVYFGIKTIFEDKNAFDQYSYQQKHEKKALIFACEPHDVLPYSVFVFNPSLKIIPGKVGDEGCALMTGAAFLIPFMRQVFTWIGGKSVDKQTFKSRLENGQSLAFCPGGVQEVLLMDNKNHPEELVLFLQQRKGFVKLALEYGSPIVPCFHFHLDGSFGYVLPKGKVIATIARTIGFAPLFFWGRFYMPFGVPFPTKISVVFGKPILIPKLDAKDITSDVVEKYHAIFVKELCALFERHKHEEGYGEKTLKIL